MSKQNEPHKAAANAVQYFLMQPGQMLSGFEKVRQEVGNSALFLQELTRLQKMLKVLVATMQPDPLPGEMWPEWFQGALAPELPSSDYTGLRRLTTEALLAALESGALERIELAYWRWHGVMTASLVIDAFYKGGPLNTRAAEHKRKPDDRQVQMPFRVINGMFERFEGSNRFTVDRELLERFKAHYLYKNGSPHGWIKAIAAYGVTAYDIKQLWPDHNRDRKRRVPS